jgi:cysteine-rich repeat protein
MTRARRFLAAHLAALLFASGRAAALCGDGLLETSSGKEECDDGNLLPDDGCSATCGMECVRLGELVTEHTCLHGSHGPFQTVGAFAYPGPPFTDVNTPHTYFTVTLSGGAGSNRSLVLFRPAVSRRYALYLKEAYPLVLREGSAAVVEPEFEHAIAACAEADSLTWVRVYPDLRANQDYVLDIGPWDGPSVSLALEAEGFERNLYVDADGDGAGRRGAPSALSWCAAPPGYVLEGTDCDDSEPSILPGGEERCDGRDNDCDDVIDAERCALEEGGTGGASEAGHGGEPGGEPECEPSGQSGETGAGGSNERDEPGGRGGESGAPDRTPSPAQDPGCACNVGRRRGERGALALCLLVAFFRRLTRRPD